MIELMIVVAIISILAAVAMPQYQNYILRTQMARALGELNSLRTAVEICQSDANMSATCATDNVDSDMLITMPTVTLGATPTISAAFGQNAHLKLTGGTILIQRLANGKWECEMTVPNVNPELIPKPCQP